MSGQTYLARVRNIPQDSEIESDGIAETFTYRMRELVDQVVAVEKTEYLGWYQQTEGHRFWFHESWLANIQEVE